MSKLKRCPFCGGEFEPMEKLKHFYSHPENECMLSYLAINTMDNQEVELWNTRKPMQNIVERLEEAEAYEDDFMDEMSCGAKCAYSHAIKIVKEEGVI